MRLGTPLLTVVLALSLASPAAGSPLSAMQEEADALVRGTLQARTGTLLSGDGRLDLVARWLAGAALREAQEPAAVRHHLWAEGVRDFEFLPITVVRDGDPLEPLPELLDDRAVPWERYNTLAVAVARRGKNRSVVVLLTRRTASFTPAPDPQELLVRLAGDYRDPAVYATRPDGLVDRRPARPAGSSWSLDVSTGVEGAWLFELMAEGPRGPEVLALWPGVDADGLPLSGGGVDLLGRAPAEAPPRPGPPDPTDPFPEEGPVAWNPYAQVDTGEIPKDSAGWVAGSAAGPDRRPTPEDAKAAEDQLWGLIDSTRRSRGLLPLRRDPQITRAARKQARELSGGDFGHETLSGTALDRLGAEGLTAARVTENIARATDVAQAHAALMASPAHRANLLDPDVTSGGVGIVLRRDPDGRWSAVISEVFAVLLAQTGGADWPVVLEHRINDRRRAAGLPALVHRETMAELASRVAREVAEGTEASLPAERRSQLAEEIRFHYMNARNVGIDLVITAEPASVAGLGHVVEPTFREMGIGAVRLESRLGAHAVGSLVVVVVFVER